MKIKENQKVLNSLVRTVGKLSHFFDENKTYKCFLSDVYRYENEKCEGYDEFLNHYLNYSIHYCPIRSSPKKLRSELINYLRNCLHQDVFTTGFTAIRHLGRIKNSIIDFQTEQLKYQKMKKRNPVFFEKDEHNNIWTSEEEKNEFVKNLQMVETNELNDMKEENNEEEQESNGKKSCVFKKRKGKEKEKEIGEEKKVEKSSNMSNSKQISNNKGSVLKKINTFKNEIKKGTLLIAHPLTCSNLWNRSVILITQREKNNIVCGLILNKHPLFNNYMELSNDKDVIRILNKLYFKNRKILKELAESFIEQGKQENTVSKVKWNELKKENEKFLEDKRDGKKEILYDPLKGNSEKKKEGNEEQLFKENKEIIQCITNNIKEQKKGGRKRKEKEKFTEEEEEEKKTKKNEENGNNTAEEDFPTIKDLQEMFLRIQFRTSSKHYINKKIKKKNNFFVMMDEHLLDIITHYIIKLNKVPLYLRFLPSYNIGSIIDIRTEIKKLQFLNEFYKNYFEKYNKWKLVLVNNRVHIFDKEKNSRNWGKATNFTGTDKTSPNVEEPKLTKEEKERIHRKIQKFKETNKIYDDDEELDEELEDDDTTTEDKTNFYEKEHGRKSTTGVEPLVKNKPQVITVDKENDNESDQEEDEEEEDMMEDKSEEDDEDDVNNTDKENDNDNDNMYDDEGEEEEEEDEDIEDDDEDEEVYENYKCNAENSNYTNENKKQTTTNTNTLDKIKIHSINRNYFIKNPVSLFWLGGPLPALTILHNNKAFSKNTIINDLIFEGYCEENNMNYIESGEKTQQEEISEKTLLQNANQNLEKVEKEEDKKKPMESTIKNEVRQENKTNEEYEKEEIRNQTSLTFHTNTNTNEQGKKKCKVKRFIGKATWDLHQLIDELNNGFWIAMNCNNNELLSKIIFNSNVDYEKENESLSFDISEKNPLPNFYKGEFLWQKIIGSLGKEYENISKISQNMVDTVLKDFKSVESE